MNNVYVVGLTGSTGAGKSEVARVLAEKGCAVIDADVLSRRAVEPGSPCLSALTEYFSEDILLPDGSLDRKALAAVAFASPEKTQVLNGIVHPVVIRMTHAALKEAESQGKTIAVIDAPLLFQARLDAICDRTVAVLAPADLRLSRICSRDGITAEQARARMKAQPMDDYYTQRATIILYNTGDRNDLRDKALALFEQLEEWRLEK